LTRASSSEGIHDDAGEPDVVRAGDEGEEPTSEPVVVDMERAGSTDPALK